jgi:aqualysin 1
MLSFSRPTPVRAIRTAAICAALLLAACQDPGEPPPAGDPALASLSGARGGRFIVILPSGVDAAAAARRHGVEADYVYSNVLNGFAAFLPEQALRSLQAEGRARRIVKDDVAHYTAMEGVQTDADWGIDRIDQRALPLDGRYTYGRTGAGVSIYIVDSGIRFSHSDFEGRAVLGHDFAWGVDPEENLDPDQGPGEDCYGHGTMVASAAGGRTYGVAKGARLVSVRLSGCRTNEFFWSRVIAAMEWVAGDHLARRQVDPLASSVANMSFAGSTNEAVDEAVRNMIAAGVVATVAAANSGQRDHACRISPAGVREALTVGATERSDYRASFSTWGDCVDLYAPGADIAGAGHKSDTDVRRGSGTSLSAPFTAGAAALYLEANPAAPAADVFAAVLAATTRDIVIHRDSTTQRNGRKTYTETAIGHLLFSRFQLAAPPTGAVAPTASFSYSCDNSSSCSFASTSTAGSAAIVREDWSTAAGHSATGTDVTFTFNSAGTYTVRLNVTDANGLTDSAEASVKCSSNPKHGIRCS